MISELIDFAHNQPILVGGVGTVLMTSALYIARSIPRKIGGFISSNIVSTFFIDNKNEYYNSVNSLLSDCILPWTFRNYEPSENSFDDFFDNSVQQTFLIPGYGSGWGIWKNTVFSFTKEREDHGNNPIKKLWIHFYSRDKRKIQNFFSDALTFETKGEQKLFISSGGHWSRAPNKKLRSLDTIFLNSDIKEKILKGLESFLQNEDYFSQRGIPYKFCMMFYGVPGTGKTSLIHALASHFNFNIYYINSLGSIGTLLSNKYISSGILVIEDIDSLAETLSREEKEKGTTSLHDLLNSLDGFTSQHGMILAITSNHPERLDSALIRPGRIDLALEIGP